MKPLKTAIPAVTALALVFAPATSSGGEDIGALLSYPSTISELDDIVAKYGPELFEDRRDELIGLIREGSRDQAFNVALLLRLLDPPYIGVSTVSADGEVTFTDDAHVIYQRMTAPEIDAPLFQALDELLMSGSGMLFTYLGEPLRAARPSVRRGKGSKSRNSSRSKKAIVSYGPPIYGAEEIAEGRSRIAVTNAIAQEFPASTFAPFSEWAVGDLYVEMFLFGEGHDPSFLDDAAAAYRDAFTRRLEREIGDQPEQRLFDDLGFRLAIALTLMGDVDGARSVLDEIENNVIKNGPEIKSIDQVYVDHYLPFHGPQVNTILNSYDFIGHLRAYLNSALPFDPVELAALDSEAFFERLEPFVDYLGAFENRDFKVIFASSLNISDITAWIEEYQPKIDEAGIAVQLQHVGGDPWHGLATEGRFTRAEAEELRLTLMELGLPRDAYLWRPRAL